MDSAQKKIRENYLKNEPHITIKPLQGMLFEEDEHFEKKLKTLEKEYKLEKTIEIEGFYREYRGKIKGKNTVDKVEIPIGERGQTYCFTIPEMTLSPFGPVLKKICLEKEGEGKEILVPLKKLQRILERENKISFYHIYLKNPENIQKFSKELEKIMPEGLKLETLYERNFPIFYALKMEKISMVAGVFLILFVSIFQLYFSLKLLLFHYKPSWAIFKVFGMDLRDIRKIFRLFCFYIFTLASISAFLISIIIIKAQNYYHFFPFPEELSHFSFINYQIPFLEFFVLFFILIALSFLIGEMIGRQADKLNLMEILRVPQ